MLVFLIIAGFQQRDGQDSQNRNNDTFRRLPVTSAHCFIRTEKCSGAGIISNFHDDDYSQGYGQIKEAFRALTKDDVLQPCISLENFQSSNVRSDDVGYNLYVFAIRYQQNSTASQPIKLEIKTEGVVPNDIKEYALVLKNKLVSVSSDRQQHFDLI